jgi:hypothetical protein
VNREKWAAKNEKQRNLMAVWLRQFISLTVFAKPSKETKSGEHARESD